MMPSAPVSISASTSSGPSRRRHTPCTGAASKTFAPLPTSCTRRTLVTRHEPVAFADVAAFLSPAWLAALQEAADGAPPSAGAGVDGPRVVVQQVVTGGPTGIVEYHVVVDGGV